MRTHNNSRLPSFVLIGLLIAIALLAYSYWSVSLKNSDLVKNMEEQSDDLKRERLKKRELNQRLEAMDQKLKEYMADFEKEKTQTKNFEKAWNSCRAELSDAQHEYELAKSDASVCQNKMVGHLAQCIVSDRHYKLIFVDSIILLHVLQHQCFFKLQCIFY